MESLDRGESLLSHVPGEGHREIIAQGEQLTTLVLKVVNKLAVFTIFTSEGLLELKDWSVDFRSTVLFEYGSDGVEGLLLDGHLGGAHVTRTFGALRSSCARVGLFNGFHDGRLKLTVTEEIHLTLKKGLITSALSFKNLKIIEELARAFSESNGSSIFPLLLGGLFIVLLGSISCGLFCFHFILFGFVRFVN